MYDDRKKSKFLNYGKFDLFAALSVPDADCMHLETCIMFFFWAFSVCKTSHSLSGFVSSHPRMQTDDLSDEGDLQSKPDAVQAGHDISVSVYTNPDGPRPQYPYAAMFYECVFSFRLGPKSMT